MSRVGFLVQSELLKVYSRRFARLIYFKQCHCQPTLQTEEELVDNALCSILRSDLMDDYENTVEKIKLSIASEVYKLFDDEEVRRGILNKIKSLEPREICPRMN